AAMKTARGTTPVGNLTNDQVLKSAGSYCEANPGSNLANAANEWYASLPKQTDPQQAEAKPESKAAARSSISIPRRAESRCSTGARVLCRPREAFAVRGIRKCCDARR